MRLTADLIHRSLSYINPIGERELDLRGHKIPLIENLGVASSDQDCIDFSDNDIATIGNFPLNTRLRTLLLARNRVARIEPNVAQAIPNVSTLVLTQNNFAQLADLDPLAGWKQLTHLVLIDNPVTGKEHYRYWVIWRCPTVRFFDYQKVKDVERNKAQQLFGSVNEPTELAKSIMSRKSRGFASAVNGAPVGEKGTTIKLTEKQREKIREQLKKATTLEEITRFEKMLAENRFPSDLDDRMDQS